MESEPPAFLVKILTDYLCIYYFVDLKITNHCIFVHLYNIKILSDVSPAVVKKYLSIYRVFHIRVARQICFFNIVVEKLE